MAGFRPPGRDGWGLQRVGEQRHRGAFAGSNFSARHFDGRLPELSAREVYYLANLNDGTTRARFRGHPTGLRNQGVTDFRPNLRRGYLAIAEACNLRHEHEWCLWQDVKFPDSEFEHLLVH